MKTMKLLMSVTSLCATILALLLLWNESEVSCGTTWAKGFITLFIIVALLAMREATLIKWK